MGKLIVFLQTNKTTGAACNPGLSPDEVVDLVGRATPGDFPICVKREGMGRVGVTYDSTFAGSPTQASLVSLLAVLESLEEGI